MKAGAIVRYLSYFEKSRRDLLEKFILDVGSGYPVFAMECAEKSIAQVVSLEKNFKSFGLVRNSPPAQELCLVIGQAERLPIRDNVFDLVIALFSVPILCQSKKSVERAIDEMCRVAKHGGEIWLSPLTREDKPELNAWIAEKLVGLARENQYPLIVNKIQHEIDGLPGQSKTLTYCLLKKQRGGKNGV